MARKPLSTSRLAGGVPALCRGAGRQCRGAAWQPLPAERGWRGTFPGIPSHGDRAWLGSSVHKCFPAWFWAAGAPHPWCQCRGQGLQGPVPGAVLPIWVEEGLSMQRGEAAGMGLFRLESLCPTLPLLRDTKPNIRSTSSNWQTSG